MKFDIVGAGILGLCLGIILKEKGNEVIIYEKKSYAGGRLIPFKDKELYDIKMQYCEIDSKYILPFRDLLFNDIYLKKVSIYKKINLRNNVVINIEVGREKVEKLFYKFASESDKKIVDYIFKSVDYIYDKNKVTGNKDFFEGIKNFFKKTSVKEREIKKINVAKILDRVESLELREIIASIANKESSYMNLIDCLYKISYSELFYIDNNLGDMINSLESRFLALGGEINYNTKLLVDKSEEHIDICVNEKVRKSDNLIITTTNISNIVEIFQRKTVLDRLEKLVGDIKIYDAYLIINLKCNKKFERLQGINRFVAKEPFVDSAGAFHRKYEVYSKEEESYQYLSIYIRGNYAYWSKMKNSKNCDVNLSKEVVLKLIVEELNRQVDGVKDSIVDSSVITPYEMFFENNFFIGSSRGIIPNVRCYDKELQVLDKQGKIKHASIVFNNKSFIEKILANLEVLISDINKL